MQGKYITFLFLLTLLIGNVSSVNAQRIDVWVESETSGRLFEGCSMSLAIQVQDGDNLMKSDVRPAVVIKCTGAAEYTNLPELVDLIDGKVTLPFEIESLPESLHATEGTITVFFEDQPNQQSDTTYVFYSRPTYEVSYVKPTSMFSGKLELNIQGGSPYMLRQWVSGGEPVDARLPFSQSEIANSSEGDVLLLWEPNSCWNFRIELVSNNGGGINPPGPTIQRPITIPFLANANTEPSAGVHYVNSMENFRFTIIPHSGHEGLAPIVTTDRNVPDEEGVVIESNEDGSYTVFILRVQTATNINIQIPLANELISDQKVWAENGRLFISSIAGKRIDIYSVTGQLIKTINSVSGETKEVTLPNGLYIIVADNLKVQKVIVN